MNVCTETKMLWVFARQTPSIICWVCVDFRCLGMVSLSRSAGWLWQKFFVLPPMAEIVAVSQPCDSCFHIRAWVHFGQICWCWLRIVYLDLGWYQVESVTSAIWALERIPGIWNLRCMAFKQLECGKEPLRGTGRSAPSHYAFLSNIIPLGH